MMALTYRCFETHCFACPVIYVCFPHTFGHAVPSFLENLEYIIFINELFEVCLILKSVQYIHISMQYLSHILHNKVGIECALI